MLAAIAAPLRRVSIAPSAWRLRARPAARWRSRRRRSAARRRLRGSWGSASGSASGGVRCCRRLRRDRLVVGEELAPGLTDRLRVLPELLVHLLDQPRVGPEARSRRRRRAHVSTVPAARSLEDSRPSVTPGKRLRSFLYSLLAPRGHRTTASGGQDLSSPSTEKIRNVAIVGHSGSGKTTLIEALLLRAGVIGQGGAGRGWDHGLRHRARGGQADDVAVAGPRPVRVDGERRRHVRRQPHRHPRLHRLRRRRRRRPVRRRPGRARRQRRRRHRGRHRGRPGRSAPPPASRGWCSSTRRTSRGPTSTASSSS